MNIHIREKCDAGDEKKHLSRCPRSGGSLEIVLWLHCTSGQFPWSARCRSDSDSFHLIEADFVMPAVVKLRRARAGVVGHRGGVFQGATVF